MEAFGLCRSIMWTGGQLHVTIRQQSKPTPVYGNTHRSGGGGGCSLFDDGEFYSVTLAFVVYLTGCAAVSSIVCIL
jgi:hypothetical protein